MITQVWTDNFAWGAIFGIAAFRGLVFVCGWVAKKIHDPKWAYPESVPVPRQAPQMCSCGSCIDPEGFCYACENKCDVCERRGVVAMNLNGVSYRDACLKGQDLLAKRAVQAAWFVARVAALRKSSHGDTTGLLGCHAEVLDKHVQGCLNGEEP